VTPRMGGHTVPILFPKVSDKPWEVIAEVHRDRSMASFRAVLREVEAEALAEAAGGDIEAAAHHGSNRSTPETGNRRRRACGAG
jgi:hypothetical protein